LQLGAVGGRFRQGNGKLIARFRAVPEKKRVPNRPAGLWVPFGTTAPPVPIDSGPPGRATQVLDEDSAAWYTAGHE